ncbi:MAG TPA: response regulator transcription factor [Stellaceae bacterium]|nr:response regulator transcription factor [Stellaceae bacterium]
MEQGGTILAIIDSSALFRAGLARLLSMLGFGEVVEAASVEALQRQDNGCAAPDILLVNLSRGGGAPDDLMQQVKTALPDAKVVFLASDLDMEGLVACFGAGASGYLLENISSSALQESLRLVSAGGKVFPPEMAALISGFLSKRDEAAEHPVDLRDARLSDREIQILRCLAAGQSNKRIAHTLAIADSTVKVHVGRILRKIHAANRTQAALWAAAKGLTMIVLIATGKGL